MFASATNGTAIKSRTGRACIGKRFQDRLIGNFVIVFVVIHLFAFALSCFSKL